MSYYSLFGKASGAVGSIPGSVFDSPPSPPISLGHFSSPTMYMDISRVALTGHNQIRRNVPVAFHFVCAFFPGHADEMKGKRKVTKSGFITENLSLPGRRRNEFLLTFSQVVVVSIL